MQYEREQQKTLLFFSHFYDGKNSDKAGDGSRQTQMKAEEEENEQSHVILAARGVFLHILLPYMSYLPIISETSSRIMPCKYLARYINGCARNRSGDSLFCPLENIIWSIKQVNIDEGESVHRTILVAVRQRSGETL